MHCTRAPQRGPGYPVGCRFRTASSQAQIPDSLRMVCNTSDGESNSSVVTWFTEGSPDLQTAVYYEEAHTALTCSALRDLYDKSWAQ
eukprot:6188156-Pyramimonas_sp.AAC.1